MTRTPYRLPTVLNRVLNHPVEVPLHLFFVAMGIFAAIGIAAPAAGFAERPLVSAALAALPWWLAAGFSVTFAAGGALCLAGIFDDDADLIVGWRRERGGLVLSATGWLAYSGAVALIVRGPPFTWGFGLTLAAGFGLRLWATYRDEALARVILTPPAEAQPDPEVDR